MFKKIFFVLSIIYSINSLSAQTAPTTQASNLQFLGLEAYGVTLNYTAATDANKYLVLRSTQPITATPTNGQKYQQGEWIGNAKVIKISSGSYFFVRESVANTKYYFTIFAFNDGANPKYNTNNPLTGNVTTKGKTLGNYYSNYRIDVSTAVADMTNLLKAHVNLDYGEYYQRLVKNVYERDTVISGNNKKYIVCDYSNNKYFYDDGTYSNSAYNREHVLPRSWMPSSPAYGDKEFSDYHNLFPVKASVNSKRSNHPEGEVVNSTWTDNLSKYGRDANNNYVFEPKESIKGNVARAMFYQIITYNGLSDSWAFNDLLSRGNQQDVNVLLQWHNQDPVDNFEIARNEYIYTIQENRNPFIDHPEWVNCIDFKTLTLSGNCPLDTAENDNPNPISNIAKNNAFRIFPNPSQGKTQIVLKENFKLKQLNLYNMQGKKITLDFEQNEEIIYFNAENLSKGIYFVEISGENHIYRQIFQVSK